MKFILTLHGETLWNIEKVLQGQMDTELHEVGIANATEKGEILLARKEKITRIISSDLMRSIQTAEIINEFFHVPSETDARLRECSYGSLEGLNKYHIEIERVLGHAWQESYEDYDYHTYGGESYSDVLGRHIELLDDLKRRYAGEMILLVGHGRGMNTLLSTFDQENIHMKRDEIRYVEY